MIAGALSVPLLLFAGTLPGSGCNYTKPGLVFEKACLDDACRATVRKHLPACQRRMSGKLSKMIRHADGDVKSPYLSLAVMEQLTDCIANAGFGTFDRSSVDFSSFTEVSKDVLGAEPKRVGGSCSGNNCSGLYLRPVVGQTTFLFGPA